MQIYIALMTKLSDGEWHSRESLISDVTPFVRPERALRIYETVMEKNARRGYRAAEVDTATAVIRGKVMCVQSAIRHLCNGKKCVDRDPNNLDTIRLNIKGIKEAMLILNTLGEAWKQMASQKLYQLRADAEIERGGEVPPEETNVGASRINVLPITRKATEGV